MVTIVPAPVRRLANRVEHRIARSPIRGDAVSYIVALGAVLALDSADKGAVGGLAPTLEHDLHITHFDIGLLASAVSLVSAVATVPIGVMTDRMRRMLLLTVSVALWSVAMGAGAFAVSFGTLLATRLALGAVSATSGPTVTSLTGDMFPRKDRARALSLIQIGEGAGVGIGLLLAGAVIALLSWRWVFGLLAVFGAALAWWLSRLPEPDRTDPAEEAAAGRDDPVILAIEEQQIEPDPDLVITGDPSDEPLATAMRNVLRIPTNVIVIIAGTIGYFFFAVLRTFAVLFATAQYSISNSQAAMLVLVVGGGALVGVVVGAWAADVLVRHGIANGRIVVAVVGYVLSSVALLPALLTHSLAVALPFLIIGAAGLGAPNPPLDAVRLDVVHPGLWGRAESLRTLARTLGETLAPILFGYLADTLGGGGHRGLQLAMLIALPTLLLNGLVLLFAMRTYLRDVASVLASTDASD